MTATDRSGGPVLPEAAGGALELDRAAPVRATFSPKLQALGKRLVMQLATVLRTSRLHDSSNQAFLIAVESLKDTINTLWAAVGPIRLQFVQDLVYLNDVRLRIDGGMRAPLTHLQEELDAKHLGGLVFQRPVDTQAVRTFVTLLSRPIEDREGSEALRRTLSEMKELALELLERQAFTDHNPREIRIDKKTFGLQTYAKAVVAASECLACLFEGRDPMTARLPVTRIVQDLIDIATERVNFLIRLGAIKRSESYVAAHAANTTVISLVIGKALDIPRVRLVDLGTAAMLADLPYALVDPALLGGTTVLGPREKAALDDAVKAQLDRLVPGGHLDEAAMRRLVVAEEHHRPFTDPTTGARSDLHLFSRIVAVADAYDALTTRRPWREGFTPDEALRVLVHESGARFDPVLVKVLVNLLGVFPLGSAVLLASGELAVVYHNSNDPERFARPWVRILRGPGGERIARTSIRNLAEHAGPGGRIVRTATRQELGGLDPSTLLLG